MTTDQNQIKELAEYLRSIAANFEMPGMLFEAASALDALHRIQGAALPHEIARIERHHNAQLTRLGIETSNQAGKDADVDRTTLLDALRAKEAEHQSALDRSRAAIDLLETAMQRAAFERYEARAQLAQAQLEIKLLRFGLCSGVENCGHCRIEAWKEASDCETPEELAELRETLRNVEDVSNGYKSVLDAIPECPSHGPGCVPYAREWIAKAKRAAISLDTFAQSQP